MMNNFFRYKKIVTFYSYKGGVGRSMALANVAWLLATKYQKRVIIVDWDLEAPGLHRYFNLKDRDIESRGLIDLFQDYKELFTKKIEGHLSNYFSLEDYLTNILPIKSEGSISILPAGKFDQDFIDKVHYFNWQDFFDNWKGYHFVEFLKSELEKLADYILVDSRTGITDIGGICTKQLPELVVICFSYNQQNILGVKSVAKSILKNTSDIILLPSRVDVSDELDLRLKWENYAKLKLKSLIEKDFVNNAEYFVDNKIPYIPRFSFGESLTVKQYPVYELSNAYLNLCNKIKDTLDQRFPKTPQWVLNLIDNAIEIGSKSVKIIQPVNKTQLTFFPLELTKINGLERLEIKGCNLKGFPNRLSKLYDLKVLILERNEIKDISFLRFFENLYYLDISFNANIKNYSFIGNLFNLKKLKLIANQLSDISFISQISNLRDLHLSQNSLENICSIKNLHKLEYLDLSSNKLKEISSLSNLYKLESLNLSNNLISNVNDLESLDDLESLNLANNKIEEIKSLFLLKNLISLNVKNNLISKLYSLRKLTRISYFNISENNITDMSPLMELINRGLQVVWDFSTFEKQLIANDNPWISPPIEIIRNGNNAIIQYYQELEKQGSDNLYEAKMLILGDGGVGKTSLANKLIDYDTDLPKEGETTKGIDILKKIILIKNGIELTINIWDFGGQEIYHSTHQFFLTKRSLYVLVDDTRKDDFLVNSPSFNYWLQTVKLFGAGSPLIIVQNEKGGRSKDIDIKSMQKQFDFIKNCYQTNLYTKEGLAQLENGIQYHISQLPHIGEKLPKQWVAIRKELNALSVDQPYITWEKYFNLCKKYNISEKKRAKNLSNYLHDLGTFLHFADDPLLNKTIFLQNEWVTYAVYALLDNQDVKSNKGLFNSKHISSIWQGTYEDMHAELLALLLNFELCYKIPERNEEYLIPQLLPETQPEFEFYSDDNIQFRYKYEFMPKGLLSRFIVRTNRYLENINKAWKKGVVLEKNSTTAIVRELYVQNEIVINVMGAHKKTLMTIVVEEIDRINNNFTGIKVQKLIPCICYECQNNIKPHFYRHKSLLKRIERGKRTVECDHSYEDVSVSGLMDHIFVREKSLKVDRYLSNSLVPMKMFISFTHKDYAYLERLETHLAGLRREGLVENWDDTKFGIGDHWSQVIEDRLRSSDIVILLVSADFINSDFINNVELPIIAEMERSHQCKVFPVIVESCDWESNKHFSHLQAASYQVEGGVMKDDKKQRRTIPIGESQYPEKIYTEIVKTIRRYIEFKRQ